MFMLVRCVNDVDPQAAAPPKPQPPWAMPPLPLAGPDVDLDDSIRSYRYTVQHNAATRKGLA